jgi:hypothetical protein
MQLIVRFLKDESAATAIEYGLLGSQLQGCSRLFGCNARPALLQAT